MPVDDTQVESRRGSAFDVCAGLLLFATILWGCSLRAGSDSVGESGASRAEPPVVEAADRAVPAAATEDEVETDEPATDEAVETVRDPYTVDLTIEDFEDPQEGWLKIAGQSEAGATSTAHGRYVGNNEFYLETRNVNAFSINLASLPELPGRRLTIHLDGQNMVVFPKGAALTFTRATTGQWELLKR